MRSIFILFTLIPALAFASPAEEREEHHIPILDTANALVGGQINTVANRFDLFFADQRADDELARSKVRIFKRYEIRERSLMKDEFQIRFNLRLPKLQQRFKFDKAMMEKSAKEKAKAGATADLAKNRLNESWQFRADMGVGARIPPTIFTRGRLRKNFHTGDVIHRFVEQIAWYSDRDWEQETTFDSDIRLDEELLFRFKNSSDWKITRKDFDTAHGPVILHRLTDDDAMTYGAGLSTIVIDSSWYVTNYRIGPTYRRNLYRQMLYVDLETGLDFPKKWSFRRTPFFGVKVEALFGGI